MGKEKALKFSDFVQVTREQEDDLYNLYGRMRETMALIKHMRDKRGGDLLVLLAMSFVVADLSREE